MESTLQDIELAQLGVDAERAEIAFNKAQIALKEAALAKKQRVIDVARAKLAESQAE